MKREKQRGRLDTDLDQIKERFTEGLLCILITVVGILNCLKNTSNSVLHFRRFYKIAEALSNCGMDNVHRVHDKCNMLGFLKQKTFKRM